MYHEIGLLLQEDALDKAEEALEYTWNRTAETVKDVSNHVTAALSKQTYRRSERRRRVSFSLTPQKHSADQRTSHHQYNVAHHHGDDLTQLVHDGELLPLHAGSDLVVDPWPHQRATAVQANTARDEYIKAKLEGLILHDVAKAVFNGLETFINAENKFKNRFRKAREGDVLPLRKFARRPSRRDTTWEEYETQRVLDGELTEDEHQRLQNGETPKFNARDLAFVRDLRQYREDRQLEEEDSRNLYFGALPTPPMKQSDRNLSEDM